MQPAITDEQILALIPRCQAADQAAIEVVYHLYGDRLYRYLLARTGDADTAADLSIELFVRVIQHIDRFKLDRRRPAASFSAWLYRIAANLVTDFYRSHSRSPAALPESLPAPRGSTDPQLLAEQHEGAASLAAALSLLSEEQRLVIVGKFIENMSNAETATALAQTPRPRQTATALAQTPRPRLTAQAQTATAQAQTATQEPTATPTPTATQEPTSAPQPTSTPEPTRPGPGPGPGPGRP